MLYWEKDPLSFQTWLQLNLTSSLNVERRKRWTFLKDIVDIICVERSRNANYRSDAIYTRNAVMLFVLSPQAQFYCIY